MAAKRLFTDDLHHARTLSNNFSASSGTSDELTQMLRNAGSRVRKSVTEGYRTAPSSFSQTRSMPALPGAIIFCSIQDTMRDIHANADTLISGPGNSAARKRARSVSESDAEAVAKDCDESSDPPAGPQQSISNRPIKSLSASRSRRALAQTHSLPAGTLSFTGAPPSQVSSVTYEEDWSQVSQPEFQPMSFD